MKSTKSGQRSSAPPPSKPQNPGKPRKPRPVQSHEVRIIGGLWKRTKLAIADQPDLRPTPDRVRETLFNWLGQDLTGWRCIDVFAGTGVLGFEAASRGAAQVQVVEQDAALVRQLQRVQTQLQASAVQVVRGDGVALLRSCPAQSMNLVFLDPPFDRVLDSDLFDRALQAAASAVSAQGFVYLEAPLAWGQDALAAAGLGLYRHLKAGAVHAHLLTRVPTSSSFHF